MAIIDKETLAEFPSPRGDKRVLKISEVNGKPRIDFRESYQNDEGEWAFTRKGTFIAPTEIDDFIKALQAAKKSLAKTG